MGFAAPDTEANIAVTKNEPPRTDPAVAVALMLAACGGVAVAAVVGLTLTLTPAFDTPGVETSPLAQSAPQESPERASARTETARLNP
jgi:hypothetical protein